MAARWLQVLTAQQRKLSNAFDGLLPDEYQVDGNKHFVDHMVFPFLHYDAVVYDIGGGKNPLIDTHTKTRLRLRVIGLDIDGTELATSPPGAYDTQICADIAEYQGNGDGDVVICQALLEHVPNTESGLASIASILKPGGRALLFLPSRNACFARLNLLLPEKWKRGILFTVYPETERDQGFPAYYDRCTPREMSDLAARNGLSVECCRAYYRSSYFSFFFPLHLLWRLWLMVFHAFAGTQAAETFSLVLRKTRPERE
jgi:SAM-dependent methyltransferase